MKKFIKKLIIFALVLTIFSTSASARIIKLDEIQKSKIMAMIDNQTIENKEQVISQLEHFLFNSKFCAIEGDIFPYPNSGEYTETVDDGTYMVEGILAKGCYAYSKFVSYVMHQSFGEKLYHKETEKNLTAEGVRKFILKNVQSGEHIRMGNYHSVSFVSGDEKGFYSLGYSSDNAWGGQKIEFVYYTYEEFTKYLNKLSAEWDADGRTLYVFDALKDKNEKYTFEENVSVILDKKLLSFDVDPVIIEERTYLPLRTIAETLGAQVSWDDKTKTATIEKEDTKAEFQIDNKTYKINGENFKNDVPAIILNDRTLVPVRCVSESFSLSVSWDDDTKCVILTTPKPQELEEE